MSNALRLVLVLALVAACGDSTPAIRGDAGSVTPPPGTDAGAPPRGRDAGPSDPLPSADFEARCSAPGVLLCRGFDSTDELNRISLESETGAEADGYGTMDHIAIDEAVKTSGAGSLRFEIVGRTGANHSGAYRQLMGRAFGVGETFYTQLRLRLSRTFVETNWDDVVSSSPKIVIFHHSSATCNDIEWTQVMNGWYSNIATMYTHCGQYAPGGPQDGTQWFQQGDYDCRYGAEYASDPECLHYTPDEWATFYFSATMGEWGTPTSHLQAWIARDGGAYRQWIDDPAFTLYAEGESVEGFDSVYLTTYMTRKDETADHETAYAWYDELIVSSEPIAPPSD